MNQDLYQVLGVNRTASQKDISSAYRQLARTWHPDKNQDRLAEAEAKFKEISQAYTILSDPEKRQLFDRFGFEAVNSSGGPGAESMASMFAQMFGNQGFPGGMPGMPGGAFRGHFRSGREDPLAQFHILSHQIPVTLSDLYQGREVEFKIRKRLRKAVEKPVTGNSLDQPPDGQAQSVEFQAKSTEFHEVMEISTQKFKIMPGMTYNQQYQLQGQGHYLDEQRQFGHLIIVLTPAPNEPSKFKLLSQNNPNPSAPQDLVYPLEISLKQALCGFSLPIIHLDGEILVLESQGIADLSLKNNLGQTILNLGQRCLKGYGMPALKIQNHHNSSVQVQKGNLYLDLNVVLPEPDKLELTKLTSVIPDQALDKKYTVKKEHKVCRLAELSYVESDSQNPESESESFNPSMNMPPGVECRTQ